MIRHALAEGWLLLRHRGGVSAILALALAIPICLAGLTWSMMRWMGPLVDLAHEATGTWQNVRIRAGADSGYPALYFRSPRLEWRDHED